MGQVRRCRLMFLESGLRIVMILPIALHACDRLGFFIRDLVDQTIKGHRRQPFPENKYSRCLERRHSNSFAAVLELLQSLLSLQKRTGKIWKTDCQRQLCRALWMKQLCAPQSPVPRNNNHGATGNGSAASTAAATSAAAALAVDAPSPPPRKRARIDKPRDAMTLLIEFFDIYPGLKKQIGGWIVRFGDSSTLPGGPIEAVMARLRAQIVDLAFETKSQKEQGKPRPRQCARKSQNSGQHVSYRSQFTVCRLNSQTFLRAIHRGVRLHVDIQFLPFVVWKYVYIALPEAFPDGCRCR